MHFQLAALAVVAAALLPAQKPDRSAEDLVIARLSAADAAAADAAMIDLIRGGPSSAPALRGALARAKNPGCRARAERALAICAVDAPTNAGLKVGLQVDRTEVAAGDALTFKATVCNVGDAPIALFLGMSYSGNVLENGLALQRLDPQLEGGGEQARLGNVGFCGTGAQPMVEVLPPWSSKQFTMRVGYRLEPEKESSIPHQGPQLASGYVYLPVDPDRDGGKVRLRLSCKVDPAEARVFGEPKVKPDWKGTLESNPVEFVLWQRKSR